VEALEVSYNSLDALFDNALFDDNRSSQPKPKVRTKKPTKKKRKKRA
jgi:hypothetical protein